MQVELCRLQPNPMRDFTIDPLDPDAVDALRQSIDDYGFWGGVACRALDDGTLQIAAGHHRVEAALAAGLTEADVYVRDDVTDAEMVLIYGTENATQRGNTSTALAGTVASAVRFLIKAILTGQEVYVEGDEGGAEQLFSSSDIPKLQGNLLGDQGLGRILILRFLGKIPGVNDRSVGEQLANLKASGDYARIMTAVEAELEVERQRIIAAAAAAEVERQRIAKEEEEARRRQAEAEQKAHEAEEAARVAREDTERKRQERLAAEAEVARVKAKAEAELAEQHRKEAEEKRAEFDALRRRTDAARSTAKKVASKAAERSVTFDFEGVAKHLKNAYQLQVFRTAVTGAGIQPYLPVDKQADLARHLVELAKSRQHELSAAFIREHITIILLGEKETARREDRKTRDALLREDAIARANHYQDEFCRFAYSMATAGDDLARLCAQWPAGLPFPLKPNFVKTFKNVRSILAQISAALTLND